MRTVHFSLLSGTVIGIDHYLPHSITCNPKNSGSAGRSSADAPHRKGVKGEIYDTVYYMCIPLTRLIFLKWQSA